MEKEFQMQSFGYEALSGLKGPFEGCDDKGHAFIPVRLADIGKIPVWACFSSGCRTSSPLLGRGWRIPFFESRITPFRPEWYLMIQPDGAERFFREDPMDPSHIKSGSVWSGIVKDDTIRLRAVDENGKTAIRMKYQNGRLVDMESPEGRYAFFYSKGESDARRAIECITFNGRRVFRVTRNDKDNECILHFQTAKIKCRKGSVTLGYTEEKRAMEQVVSLIELQRPDEVKKIEYEVGDDEVSFRCGKLVVTWDKSTRLVRKVNRWMYSLIGAKNDDVAFSRVHANGRCEEYSYNSRTGDRIYTDPEGIKVTQREFTGGPLCGLVRWRERSHHGEIRLREEFSYNAAGKVRYSKVLCPCAKAPPFKIERWFSDEGRLVSECVDGKKSGK